MRLTFIALSFAVGATLGATAQENLTKEIDVEREIVPELRAASRMDIFPVTLRPDLKPVTLTAGELTQAADFNPLTRRYEPAWTGAAAPVTPYRGYVDAGYFPAANFGVAAGFRAVNTPNTTLGIHTTILNRKYADKGLLAPEPDKDYKTLDINGGVDLRHRFGRKGILDVNADVDFSKFNKALHYDDQSVLRLGLGAGWKGFGANSLRYDAGIGFGLFSFGKAGFRDIPELTDYDGLKTVSEKRLGVTLGASLPAGEYGRAGVDFRGEFLFYNRFVPGESFAATLDEMAPFSNVGDIADLYMSHDGLNIGNFSFTPYYALEKGIFSGKFGVRIDVTFNSGKTLHIAPDVTLGLNPTAQFGAWVKFAGGEQLNTLGSLYAVSRYISPEFAYKTSNIPVTGEVGLRFGPVKGFALEVGGAYAVAHDWLMPAHSGAYHLNAFDIDNYSAYKVFGRLTGGWGKWVDFAMGYEHSFDAGSRSINIWYSWRDGARSVLSGDLSVHPLERLTVTVGVDGRFDRRLAAGSDFIDLRAGAQYGITDALSVFARFDNILDQHKPMVFDYTTCGFNGLFGLGYKF